MNKLEAIADHMETLGFGTPGTNIFIHNMPERVRTGILLTDDNDQSTEIDEYIPKLRRSHFRMIVRAADYAGGYQLAKSLRDAIDFYHVTLGDYVFLRIRPTYDPVAYPTPDSDTIEVSVNFWACFIEP
jgi:hypothetical protein